MTVADLQRWLNEHGAITIGVDGKYGPATRNALLAAFSNLSAPAITSDQIDGIAERLGCTRKQVMAVAKVESGGSAYDDLGRPKILFERHYFHRLTQGKWSVCAYSNGTAGGYGESSWQKLADAAGKDPDAAFQSASWGRFQIMGSHWKALGYLDEVAMPWAMREGEYGHYEALCRYVETFGLVKAIRALSTDPETCRAFAKGYNGPGYARFDYHTKLAKAMR